MASPTVGFIDIGSNTTRLIVIRFSDTDEVILEDSDVIPIGRSLYGKGRIDDSVVKESRDILDHFYEEAIDAGASEVIAFATCAFRDAEGERGLEDAMPKNMELRIISGKEEAALTRLGILGTDPVYRKTLLIDIGGGSTEFSISYGDEILLMESLPIGAVRFSYGSDHDPNLPYTEENYQAVKLRTRQTMSECAERIRKIGFERVIGCSGSFKTMKKILDLKDMPLSVDSVHTLSAMVRSMDVEQRRSVPGLGAKRADIMPAGTAIAETIMEELGIYYFEVSQKGLKDGMFTKYRLDNL